MPVVPRHTAVLGPDERARCAAVARAVLPERRLARDRLFFGPHTRPGLAPGPFVFLGDPGEIPLLARRGAGVFEYRLAMLAGDGDMVVIGGRRNTAFETYAEGRLGLGRRRYLPVAPAPGGRYLPAQIRCLKDEAAFAAMRAFVEGAGGATLVPHLSTGAIWALARRLGAETGAPVRVAGPLPSLSALANDKAAFTRIVRALFGAGAAPREVVAHSAAALTARVHEIARGCRRLVLKLPDSAGSAGNFPVFSADVAGMSPRALHRHLLERLAITGAPPSFPMLVQVWQENVLTSPSLQLWIPHPGDGRPVIEGVFHQRLAGPEGRFAGAVPAEGDAGWIARFCHEGAMLGQVLQDLGYFGRCSFDAVLSGADLAAPALHWLECNGRWGGVSIPMTLMNRLFPGGEPPSYVVAHLADLELPRRSVEAGLDLLRDLLWAPGADRGVVFMTPAGFEQGRGLHFISIADSTAAASAQAETVVDRLMTRP
ncbi:hypothetical protein [Actibacterium sp. MT2.3-13A]|uniref:preATP grasp domain-containing protein n=1 Tax=Actibacterium sp. MT2.3-13A TaxID=2828332 RepID=UPI001BA8E646|nr:hypothetical protein [Actibacterium sp. MT2.3-13A]